jgi:hypothetical protein
MNRLHHSYDTLSSWKVEQDEPNHLIRVFYNKNSGLLGSGILFVFTTFCSWWIFNLGQGFAHKAGSVFIFSVGALMIYYVFIKRSREGKKGDVLRYHTKNDVIEFPRENRCILDAKKTIEFTSEHHIEKKGTENTTNHYFELNYIFEGQRLPLLSSLSGYRLKGITKALEYHGFKLTRHKLKK